MGSYVVFYVNSDYAQYYSILDELIEEERHKRETEKNLILHGFRQLHKQLRLGENGNHVYRLFFESKIDVVSSENTVLPPQSRHLQSDVFVALPFQDKFFRVYEHAIKPAVESITRGDGQQLKVVKGDDIFVSGSLIDKIRRQIEHTNLVIADCTQKNANVFFEIGYAIALNKLLIPIAQSIDDIPVDIRDREYHTYSDGMGQDQQLKIWIQKAIRDVLHLPRDQQ